MTKRLDTPYCLNPTMPVGDRFYLMSGPSPGHQYQQGTDHVELEVHVVRDAMVWNPQPTTGSPGSWMDWRAKGWVRR